MIKRMLVYSSMLLFCAVSYMGVWLVASWIMHSLVR
jgi:hypothetical protein